MFQAGREPKVPRGQVGSRKSARALKRVRTSLMALANKGYPNLPLLFLTKLTGLKDKKLYNSK